MPPTRGISCLSLVLYGIRKGSEGLVTMKYFQVLEVVAQEDQDVVEDEDSSPPDVLNLLIGTNETPLRAAEKEARRTVGTVVLLTRQGVENSHWSRSIEILHSHWLKL